ncbi:type VI secretion system membrane subunit TssM [Lysobacter cavernae]|uniref:Type VI secretion system membrane subunit TssM n=1 Tax=Lysobacter cavernae TaxID=1685901 RepID=A0ABV7RMI7_9GAMM
MLKSAWLVTLAGLLLAALLIWLVGPYIAVAGHTPLASPVARLLSILALVGAWAGWLQWQQLRARRRATELATELAKPSALDALGDDRLARGADERNQLQARFQDAVQVLRKRRGGDLYTLPWYAVIGPPGSGKSTLLQHSGLHFPLAARFGEQGLRGIGGTRNCDWWFTEEAVFLDTAGRYTTQDSDRQVDAGAWLDFLKLLRRYRRRRPLNGVLVTMSMSDLLLLDAAERDLHVQAIRRRLDEIGEQLKMSVPVYLVFTKCDLIGGFSEFFDDLDPEQRRQVWGVSFPLARSYDGSAARGFADEYALLQDRLNARLLERMHLERDRSRRAAILSFPQQFAALGESARQFVEGVFAGTAYGTPPLLRGVYLTSGTQEGTPIDRMMGAVARSFGLAETSVQPSGAQRRTFFVERLLKQVLLRESGLAGREPAQERRHAWLQAAAYAGVALLTAALLAGLTGSYLGNRSYLAQVRSTLDARPSTPDPSSAETMPQYFALAVQQLQGTHAVEQVARQYDGRVPWSMRMGLYQGQAVGGELHGAYLRQLNGTLVPGVALRLRQGMGENATSPQALYYYLKGYLMLGQPQHLDREQLAALGSIEWRKLFPDDSVLQQALAAHFQVLLDESGRLRALSLDPALLEQARNTLRAADLATLVYGNLKLSRSGAGAAPLQLDKALGLLGNVFQRSSGTALSEPLPSLYTQPVFAALAGQGIGEAVEQFVQDDWVFGPRRIDELGKARLAQQVGVLYEQDYIRYWDGLLADLQLQPAADLQQASAIAAKLAGPSSPLRLLLALVRDNTRQLLRVAPADAGQRASAVAGKAATKAAGKLAARLPGGNTAMAAALATGSPNAAAAVAQPGSAIAAHFAVLNGLGDGASGATPLDHVYGVLDQLSKTLLTMSDPATATAQPNPQLLLARQEAAQLPPPLSGWLQSLTGSSAALMARGAKTALDTQVQQTVGAVCSEFVRGRYPFDPASASEIPLQNFGELFGNGGRFDTLRGAMQSLLDTSGRDWHWKRGPEAVTGAAGLPAQLQLADRIKQKYFRGAAMPEVGFTVLAPTLGEGVTRLTLDIDGQKYDYTSGAAESMPMKWPGPIPGHVSIAAFAADGVVLGRLNYEGDWALFRALHAGGLSSPSDLRFVAHFDVGGHAVQLPLRAGNLRNPFLDADVRRFSCGS